MRVKNIITIDQDEDKYLSFPDIIQSVKDKNKFFMVYRSGDGHHPTVSKLILKKSENSGETWETQQEFVLTIEEDRYVWNCPRLSYCNEKLYIICDAKNSTFERTAQFKTFFLISDNEGESFEIEETPIPGMVPDKIIKFNGHYYCANHKVKNEKNELIQLISSSKWGELWYDTNILAHHKDIQFCEASVVNIDDKYMRVYLRDNSGHRRNIYTAVSYTDGINWSVPEKLPIFGQRVTALRHNKNEIVGVYRNTDNQQVSLFIHNFKKNKIKKVLDVDGDYRKNQYNYGYTGLVDNGDEYLLPYYIKKDEENPYINLAFIKK